MLKAIVAQINYNLFDIELGDQQKQFAYLQAKDLVDTVSGVMVTHDVALWNGNEASLTASTTNQYMGCAAQIAAGGNSVTVTTSMKIVDTIKTPVAKMVASTGYYVRPTAIYANPVLLDLIDQEMKTRIQRGAEHRPDHGRLPREDAFDAGRRSATDSRLEFAVHSGHHSGGTYTPGTYPAYIVTEDLIEYHWLGDPAPRVFQLGLPNSLTYQYVAVKFGAPVVKGAGFAHTQVLVER